MGAIVGMILGYVLGTRAGEKGYEELKDAWRTISSSQEVRDVAVGGLALAGGLLRQGRGILAQKLMPEDPDHLRAA